MLFLRKTYKTSMEQLCSILVTTLLLWETRGACNCYYTCTHVACFMCTCTKNEWNTQNIILSLSSTFGPPITHSLIMHVLSNYHMKLLQGAALEQKPFDLLYCCLAHILLPSVITCCFILWMILGSSGLLASLVMAVCYYTSSCRKSHWSGKLHVCIIRCLDSKVNDWVL